MGKPMANPSSANTERIAAEVVKSALAAAAVRPWELVSYAEIAENSGLKAADIMAVFPQKIEILHRIVADLDQSVLQPASIDPALNFKEQLFELLMMRFDEMEAHRAAHISFLKSFGWIKSQIPAELNLYYSSLWRYWVFCQNVTEADPETAPVKDSSKPIHDVAAAQDFCGFSRTAPEHTYEYVRSGSAEMPQKANAAVESMNRFFVIYAARYLNVLRIWSLDRSADLGKTMAALNKL